MYLQQGRTLQIHIDEGVLDIDLRSVPPTLDGTSLDFDTLYRRSLDQPEQVRRISRILSRWPLLTAADVAAVVRYLAEGRRLSIVDPGNGVLGEFTDAFKTVLGLNRTYGVGFNSGTNTLHAAYRALDVQTDVMVAAVGYTFHATVTPAVDLGANLVLMDVSSHDGNVTFDIVRETVEQHPATRVVVVNHNWGFPIAEIRQIRDYLTRCGIKLLEDCSHAHGATIDQAPVGSFGDIAVFSLHAHKAVTAGEGGICFTDDLLLNQRILLFGHPGVSEATFGGSIDPSLRQTGLSGLKCRLHPLGAVLALSQLDRLPEVLANRRENAEYLRQALSDVQCIELPQPTVRAKPTYYSMRAKYIPEKNNDTNAEEFVRMLRQRGMDIEIDRVPPLSHHALYQRHWKEYGSQALESRRLYQPGDLPGSEAFCENRLVFPVFSRSLDVVQGLLDVMATHIRSATRAPALPLHRQHGVEPTSSVTAGHGKAEGNVVEVPETVAHYDAIAFMYDHLHAHRTIDTEFWTELAMELGGSVLELGCGTGRTLIPLAANGVDVTGIEASSQMLNILRERIHTLDDVVAQRIHIIEGLFPDALPQGLFRQIFLPFSVFQFLLTDQDRLLERLRAILEPGGRLVVDVARFRLHQEGRVTKPARVFQVNGNQITLHRAIEYDSAAEILTKYFEIHVLDQDGQEQVIQTQHRLRVYHRYELMYLLQLNGFLVTALYGDYLRNLPTKNPPPRTDSRLIYIARPM